MSELWRELIRRQNPELAGALALGRVSISKKTGEMCVRLCADRLLSREEYKRVRRAFADAFPAVGVRLKVAYPALKERALANVACVAPLLIELVRHESPGSAPFLLNSDTDFTLENGVFTVRATGEEGVAYMRARGVDRLFSQLLRELFSIEATTVIEVAGSEQKRLERIRAQRAAEEARITEETARGVHEPSENSRKKPAAQEAAYGRAIHDQVVPMNEMTEDIGRACVMGEVAAQSKPGANGVLFAPYMSGERCPYPDPNARGVFYGLSLSSTASCFSAGTGSEKMVRWSSRPKSCAPRSRTACGSRRAAPIATTTISAKWC